MGRNYAALLESVWAVINLPANLAPTEKVGPGKVHSVVQAVAEESRKKKILCKDKQACATTTSH